MLTTDEQIKIHACAQFQLVFSHSTHANNRKYPKKMPQLRAQINSFTNAHNIKKNVTKKEISTKICKNLLHYTQKLFEHLFKVCDVQYIFACWAQNVVRTTFSKKILKTTYTHYIP